ncbi:ADP-ribose glycohydrolase MACROD2 isoform X2 [Amia ocellicauda]|uniref:ADP-ribose glycohydrolase MACROD2 isoform X2 n=1 Tax=Amia ocellicauda TaxID=2972642 RepID=UPI00346471CC
MSKKKKDWKVEKERLLGLGLEERRKDYRGNHVPLEKIPTWRKQERSKSKDDVDESEVRPVSLSDRVSLYKGDITILEIDAIVNAANASLLGGGGVDGCIHRAAGPCLFDECHTLNGCETGHAKITCGYDLPAKYVIHTVGPVARGHVGKSQRESLKDCYENSLKLLKENGLRSVAFPCISTGIYGFPNEPAAEIALETVKNWIQKNSDEIDRIIFCVFLETDFKIYKEKMAEFFSQENDLNEEAAEGPTKEEEEEDDKEGSGEAEMKSQRDDEIKTDKADAEMESQNLEPENNPNSEEQKDESEVNNKVPASDVSPEENKLAQEPTEEDDPMEDTESEESKRSSNKDEVKSQLTEMETEAVECHNKDADSVKEGCRSQEEPKECDGVIEVAVPTDNKPPGKQETCNVEEAEMNTQTEDSQVSELTQPEPNQSKDDAGDLKDP